MTVTALPTKVKAPKPSLLQLKIQQDPDGTVTATVPVRWCVTPELLVKLEERGFVKPHVLLVVRSVTETEEHGQPVLEYRDTLVRVVPLRNEMSYISFSRPGRNQVHAIVVDIDDKAAATRLSRLQHSVGDDRYMGDNKDYWQARRSILECNGRIKDKALERDYFAVVNTIRVRASLEVTVPAEMFAPPPKPWQKRLVKTYFRDSESDQCHFRRRLIVSGLTSVVWMPLAFVIKLLATAVSVFLGRRNVPYKTVIQPLELNPITPLTDAGPSIWYFKKPDRYGNARQRPLLFKTFALPTLVVLPLVMYIIDRLMWMIEGIREEAPWLNWSLADAYLYTIGALVGFWVVVAVVAGAVIAGGWLLQKSGLVGSMSSFGERLEARRVRRSKERLQKEEERRARELAELKAMTCDRVLNPGEVSLDALPKDKQTIELRFSRFKTKVCRPFAR